MRSQETGVTVWRSCAAIVALCLAIGLPTVRSDNYFLGDDFGLVQHLHDLPIERMVSYFGSDWTEGIYGVQLDELRPILAFTYWLDARIFGTFNVTGPAHRLTWGEMLDTLRAAAGSDARFTWVDDEFLVEHKVGVFGELPFWIPASEGENFFSFDISKAQRHGLTFRPLIESARDTLVWLREREQLPKPLDDPRLAALGQVGMEPERERALLDEWHARSAATR